MNAHDILHQLTGGVLHEVTQLLGEKRQLFDFSNLLDFLHNVEQQGQAVSGNPFSVFLFTFLNASLLHIYIHGAPEGMRHWYSQYFVSHKHGMNEDTEKKRGR